MTRAHVNLLIADARIKAVRFGTATYRSAAVNLGISVGSQKNGSRALFRRMVGRPPERFRRLKKKSCSPIYDLIYAGGGGALPRSRSRRVEGSSARNCVTTSVQYRGIRRRAQVGLGWKASSNAILTFQKEAVEFYEANRVTALCDGRQSINQPLERVNAT